MNEKDFAEFLEDFAELGFKAFKAQRDAKNSQNGPNSNIGPTFNASGDQHFHGTVPCSKEHCENSCGKKRGRPLVYPKGSRILVGFTCSLAMNEDLTSMAMAKDMGKSDLIVALIRKGLKAYK